MRPFHTLRMGLFLSCPLFPLSLSSVPLFPSLPSLCGISLSLSLPCGGQRQTDMEGRSLAADLLPALWAAEPDMLTSWAGL